MHKSCEVSGACLQVNFQTKLYRNFHVQRVTGNVLLLKHDVCGVPLFGLLNLKTGVSNEPTMAFVEAILVIHGQSAPPLCR